MRGFLTPNDALPARFAPAQEEAFGTRYYAAVRPTLRVVGASLAVLFLVYAVRDYLDTHSLTLALRQDGAPAGFFLIVVGLTFWAGFGRVWQPLLVVGGWGVAALALSGPAAFFARAPVQPSDINIAFPRDLLFLSLQTCILMVAFAAFRLPFRAAIGLQTGVLIAGATVFAAHRLPGHVDRFLQPTLLVLATVLLAAFVEERLARGAFWANHLLDEERDLERRKREQTEATLGVLNRAIGGIVHDLGNPLTSVQGGAQILRQLVQTNRAEPPLVDEFAEMIEEGARMLDYLRLSLIEQSRVLEGKPTPLTLKAEAVRPLIEAGAR